MLEQQENQKQSDQDDGELAGARPTEIYRNGVRGMEGKSTG
jgi:hypothetical protein